MNKKLIKIDVMLNESYIHTFKIETNPMFIPTDEWIRDYVIERLPTLKNKDFRLYIYE